MLDALCARSAGDKPIGTGRLAERGSQDRKVEDRGLEPLTGNGRHSRPEDALLTEAALTLARILDRLTDRR